MSSLGHQPRNTSEAMPATLVQKQDIVSSKSENYSVLDIYGEGSFGIVAKCIDLRTFKTIAIKMDKSSDEEIIQREVNMLEKLRALDPDKKNLVRFIEHFMFKGLSCIAFEMLDKSLWDFTVQRQKPMSLNEIRPIAKQLLVAFEALKDLGIIHTDLKHDNVMLVNHDDEPFRVKLIDFGLAIPASEVKLGSIVQIIAYRAPEVTLGLPITEAIDMWSLGCLLAEQYFGENLFPNDSEQHMMEAICDLLGQPEDHLLNAGGYTSLYFSRVQRSPNPGWRVKTTGSFDHSTQNLNDKMWDKGYIDHVDNMDRTAFLDLLKQLLSVNAETRITPGQALKHPFITMVHLEQDRYSSFRAEAAFHLMNICSVSNSDEMDACSSIEDIDEASRKHCNDLYIYTSNTDRPNYREAAEVNCNDFQLPLQRSPSEEFKSWIVTSSHEDDSTFPVRKNDILSSKSANYLVLDLNGEGCFGVIAKCVNLKTFRTTAIKIHKVSREDLIQREVDMLEQLRTLDPEKKYVVEILDNFMFEEKKKEEEMKTSSHAIAETPMDDPDGLEELR